ncbi:hypothetical protein FB567DRAFT_579776 [Paraphoma chrysanthemicola]|uniref:RanBP2-type domain-containing protein n=1 Tax=Paraphoma chrysanthemicola TaxID=798071 RepID=A0A8K0VZ03_9PLEO|nr:hypothetical protein FB567DRAFT_579776 [Paraphoma chrysanthemicola]
MPGPDWNIEQLGSSADWPETPPEYSRKEPHVTSDEERESGASPSNKLSSSSQEPFVQLQPPFAEELEKRKDSAWYRPMESISLAYLLTDHARPDRQRRQSSISHQIAQLAFSDKTAFEQNKVQPTASASSKSRNPIQDPQRADEKMMDKLEPSKRHLLSEIQDQVETWKCTLCNELNAKERDRCTACKERLPKGKY